MSDDVTYEPSYAAPQQGSEQLQETVANLTETVREAARRTAALDARIDSLPRPSEIAAAVESEVERSVREARDVIDARVGSLESDLQSLSHRLAEVSEALIPLEGLRTEIATVADESAGFRDIRERLQTAFEHISGGKLPPLDMSSAGLAIREEMDLRLADFRALLDQTSNAIRSDFQMLVGAEQEASERRTDALGLRITNLAVGVQQTLENIGAQTERMAERARALESENAAILQSVRQEIAKAVEALPSPDRVERFEDPRIAQLLQAVHDLADRVASIESVRALTEGLASEQSVQELVDRVASLDSMRDVIDKLATRPADDLVGRVASIDSVNELGARVAAAEARLLDGLRTLQEQTAERASDPAIQDIRAQLAEMAKADPHAETIEQLRAALNGVLDGVREEVSRSVGQMTSRLDAVEAAVARAVADTSDALDGAAAQNAGGMQEVRAAVAQLGESLSGIERLRGDLFQAVESLGTQLVTRTAGVKTSVAERAARIEEHITGIPTKEAIADTVVERMRDAIASVNAKTDDVVAGMEQELGGVASNVNEIWIRVRSLVKGLEEERAAARQDATTISSRIEELARGEDRLAARLIEVEQRLGEAMRAIESERDRVFLETLHDLLEQLPRRERKLFRRRMRGIAFSRGTPQRSAALATESAQSAIAQPAQQKAQRPAATPVATPTPAAAPAEPAKRKPKPKAAKPKPKTARKPKPSPKPAAKAKPSAKPKDEQPVAPTTGPVAQKPAPRGTTPEPPDSSEVSAVIDTHATDADGSNDASQNPVPEPAPQQTPSEGSEDKKEA